MNQSTDTRPDPAWYGVNSERYLQDDAAWRRRNKE